MNIKCDNCEEVYSKYLSDIPSAWRKQIVAAICAAVATNEDIDCADVKDCETLTSLSTFSVSDGQVCVTYKDEKGVSTTRCFSTAGFSGLENGDYGDITVSGDADVWTIDDDVVTFAKMQNINTNRLLGRSTAGVGNIEELTIGTGLTLAGGELSSSSYKFGVSGEDDTAGEDREFDQLDTYNLTLTNSQFRVLGTYTYATTGLGMTIEPYDEAQMFFNPRKGAFRAGLGTSSGWYEASVGGFSAAFGANNVASGGYAMSWGTANNASNVMCTAFGTGNTASGSRCTAFGDDTLASGYNCVTWGQTTEASGHFSTAWGLGTISLSHAGTVLGTYNDDSAPALENDFDLGNRLLQIGIGWDDTDRRNGLTMLQSGHIGIGENILVPTALIHIDGSTTAAGTAPLKFASGTVMTTPEAGAVEFNGTNLFFSPSTTRNTILMTALVSAVSPTSPDRTIAVNIGGVTYYIAAKTTND